MARYSTCITRCVKNDFLRLKSWIWGGVCFMYGWTGCIDEGFHREVFQPSTVQYKLSRRFGWKTDNWINRSLQEATGFDLNLEKHLYSQHHCCETQATWNIQAAIWRSDLIRQRDQHMMWMMMCVWVGADFTRLHSPSIPPCAPISSISH